MSRAEVAQLHALQQLDLEIERAMVESQALQRALAADSAAGALVASNQSARAAKAAGQKVREAEATLAQTRERLARQEGRLYAGQVSAKDIAKAQQEIEHLRALVVSQEDALLTLMLEAEEAQAAATARERALAQAVAARERDHAEAAVKLEQAQARLDRLRGEREEHAKGCAPELLATYERSRKAHGGRGVAEVSGGVCSGCRVTVTAATLQRARASSDLPLCDNCGRILYLLS